METLEDILVFRTSICSETDIKLIASYLNSNDHIRKWNVDHQDIDHVLRIESEHHDPEYFIRLITDAGFECQVLPD